MKPVKTRANYKKAYYNYTITGRNSNINFNSLVARMHSSPARINQNIYRVINKQLVNKLLTNGYLNDAYPSSFTLNKNFAERLHSIGKNYKNTRFLVLGRGTYPAINSTRSYRSGFPYEKEVTIAPGRFVLKGFTNDGHLRVVYFPKYPIFK